MKFKSITEAKKSIQNYVKNGSELIEEIYDIQEKTIEEVYDKVKEN